MIKLNLEDTDYTIDDIQNFINQRVFSERDRYILKRKVIDDMTFEMIAEEMQCSVTTVANVYYKHRQRFINKYIKDKK